jgi:nucleoside phosphorylase
VCWTFGFRLFYHSHVSESPKEEIPLIQLVCATAEEIGPFPGIELGLGSIVVAARLAAYLAHNRPEAVLIVGTAGSLPNGPPVGSVVTAKRIGFSPGVAAMGLGYVPKPAKHIFCDPTLVLSLELPEMDVLTVGAITTDSVLVDRLGDGWQIEQMEAYGAALACQQAKVPFAAIYGIANKCGPDAHSQWLANVSAAREAVYARIAPLQHLFKPTPT